MENDISKQGIIGAVSLAILVLAIGLVGSPALAKCSHDCRKAIGTEFRDCKSACPMGKVGKDCKRACRHEKKSDVSSCKHAANPTPPGCGEASPSGAFTE
jgi:hypothetical protein